MENKNDEEYLNQIQENNLNQEENLENKSIDDDEDEMELLSIKLNRLIETVSILEDIIKISPLTDKNALHLKTIKDTFEHILEYNDDEDISFLGPSLLKYKDKENEPMNDVRNKILIDFKEKIDNQLQIAKLLSMSLKELMLITILLEINREPIIDNIIDINILNLIQSEKKEFKRILNILRIDKNDIDDMLIRLHDLL